MNVLIGQSVTCKKVFLEEAAFVHLYVHCMVCFSRQTF